MQGDSLSIVSLPALTLALTPDDERVLLDAIRFAAQRGWFLIIEPDDALQEDAPGLILLPARAASKATYIQQIIDKFAADTSLHDSHTEED